MQFDIVIVGSGPVGCAVAERAAKVCGWTSLIIEKRGHIGGNCHDRYDENGILIHQYGPHYFRTDNIQVYNYLSQFTEWVSGNYYVKSFSQGQFFSFPINLNTLEQFFNTKLTAAEALALLEKKRLKINNPQNSEEFVLSRIGKELYEAFYLNYTLKQWGCHPRNLPPSICGRIPIRTTRDEGYFDNQVQTMPKLGYSAMFSKMISDQRIQLLLKTDYKTVKNTFKPKIATVYCGPIDEYFDYKHGKLGWRSLRFDFKTYDKKLIQPCVQINYPNDFEYTRSVEIKHVTNQKHEKTVVSYEYPTSIGDPYYPIPTEENTLLYKKYVADAEIEHQKKNVYFSGRLANYSYINMDEAFEIGLKTFEKIKTSQNIA